MELPDVERTDVPEWAEDAVLDRFFASWTPGPPPDAPSAEQEMMGLVTSAGGEAGTDPAFATDGSGWARSDDDVFPGPRRRGRWGRSRGRSRR